jgi:hypothetical protein
MWRKRQIQESGDVSLTKKDFDDISMLLKWIEADVLPKQVIRDRAMKLQEQLRNSTTNLV